MHEYSSEQFNSQPNIFIFQKYAQTLVDGFLQSRLSSFNFDQDKETIQLQSADDGVDCESLSDDDMGDSDDLHRYKEILYSVGEFAKFSLEYSLPTLSKVLNDKYTQMLELLSKMAQNPNAINDFTKHMTSLSEDVHWILLISGFTLFQVSSDGDDCRSISNEVMDYSIKCSQFVDMGLIHRLFSSGLLASSGQHGQNLMANKELIETRLAGFDRLDPIVQLIFNSFQFSELENQMFSLNMLYVLSPQVASTLMWFLKEFSRSYLYMKEVNYRVIFIL